jgi:V/A-type H+-transporting ATPase subunit B
MDEERTIEQTLTLGWETLRLLPAEELTRLTEEEIDTYYAI